MKTVLHILGIAVLGGLGAAAVLTATLVGPIYLAKVAGLGDGWAIIMVGGGVGFSTVVVAKTIEHFTEE